MRSGHAAAALALFLAACGSGSSQSADHGGDAAHGAQEAHGAGFGPSGAHAAPHAPAGHAPAPHAATAGGGDHWTYLNQAAWSTLASTCNAGHEQSPINLSSAAPQSDLADLAPHYTAVGGRFVNNGHTLQFTPEQNNSTLLIGNHAFSFAQLHFHAPAEHTIDGRAYPAEVHFVHRNGEGRLAVLGVFFTAGEENPALAALLASLPTEQGDEHATQLGTLDFASLIPTDHAYFAYAGSLTTPPCSEGVRWNVLSTPITASAEQIAALREALGATSRHVQPVYERTVLLGS